jgi:hypothetical protein
MGAQIEIEIEIEIDSATSSCDGNRFLDEQ